MAMHKLRLEFTVPTDELAETARKLPKQELKELAVAAFYSKGHVTMDEAAQLLGKTK